MFCPLLEALAEKWFGSIPSGVKPARVLPEEPVQTEERRLEVKANVPLDALYMAFHMPSRTDDNYYACDLISDILSRGNSSRLFRNLIKEKKLFSDVHAYLTASLDPGLFVIEGKPAEGVTLQQAEAAIWNELNKLKTEEIKADELLKVKNKIESTMVFAEMSLLDKAMNLAYFELLGDAERLNSETIRYFNVSAADILDQANQIFKKDNASVLYYLAN